MDYAEPAPGSRLERLMTYLAADPRNLTLLGDAAETALSERRADIARDLLERYASIAPLPPKETNLLGMAALDLEDYASASAAFSALHQQSPADPALRFNLAWARAMAKDFDGALNALDEATVKALPQAAMLEIQLLHDRGAFDEAAERARAHVRTHPDHRGLLAAVSVLAMDVDDPTLAAECARRAGDHPDALTTLATLALGEDRDSDALTLFNQALERRDRSPRAWVGKGLAELAAGDHEQAARDIRHGAEMFERHIGSWIAAGWAAIVAGDIEAGRACFDTALELDHNFAETHGSLAVVSVMQGDVESARRLTQTALRLDRGSFSAALASALLAQSDGRPEVAQRVVQSALHTPVDASGRTIAQALLRRGLLT
jgi:tetratricopeptide (TPR) repeat protein